MDNDFDVRF